MFHWFPNVRCVVAAAHYISDLGFRLLQKDFGNPLLQIPLVRETPNRLVVPE